MDTGMSQKNVIIIVIDALRADRLGGYGNKKKLTPVIDKIADAGIVFEDCYSSFNATDPSFTTIITGLHPFSHGIRGHADRVEPEMLRQIRDNNVYLLSEILQKNSYFTIGLDWLGRWHEKGYDFYLGNDKYFQSIPTTEPITDHALSWIKKAKTPFFLFIHYMDVHTPYRPPEDIYNKFLPSEGSQKIPDIFSQISNEEWKKYLIDSAGTATTAEEVIAAYDAAVHYVDKEVGRIIQTLKENGLFENTIIIITSDHGESLTEHGIFFDHHGLYDESLHVPLIFANSDCPAKRIKGLVQHTDIVPTILDLLDMTYEPDFFDGRSLVPMMNDESMIFWPFIVSEEAWTEKKMALRSDTWKYIVAQSDEDAICRYCGYIHGGVEELYNLVLDPHETINCITTHPEIAKTHRDLLTGWEMMMRKRQNKRKIRKKIAGIQSKISHLFQ
jgi:arylsulfatase A-like enzyme